MNKVEKSTKRILTMNNWYIKVVLILFIFTTVFNFNYTIVRINGSSMEPNFYNNDIYLANRHYELSRFDVVVINSKNANKIIFKRIIGLPGEKIEFINNYLYVNGIYIPDIYSIGNTEDFIITLNEDEYLCLGDNRENSYDSRQQGAFTSKEIFAKINIKGKE